MTFFISRKSVFLFLALPFLTLPALRADEGVLTYQNVAALDAQRQGWIDGKPDDATKKIIANADAVLTKPIPRITEKKHLLPGANPQDYYSTAIYWWKNPDTKDGLPYIHRDGVYNPESREYDRPKLEAFGRDTLALALAYYITHDQKYSAQARKYFQTWYIDKSLRMTPNFAHAQVRPGVNDGSDAGIIEGVAFARTGPDAVTLLHMAHGIPDAEYAQIRAWYADLVHWLEDSPFGTAIRKTALNLGTWYDMQRTTYYLMLGEKNKALAVLSRVGEDRIARQIRPDGSQPAELERTKAFSYSLYNLNALITLCELGDKVGVDIWHYKAKNGASIPAAVDFLIPYASGEKSWPYKQITGMHPATLGACMLRIAPHYPDAHYAEKAKPFMDKKEKK